MKSSGVSALFLCLLLRSSEAQLNDSTLRLHQHSNNNILNATNVWSSPELGGKDLLEQLSPSSDVTDSDNHGSILGRNSIIYGLTEVSSESKVNPICHSQLKHLQRGIHSKQPWAIKVLDASGTKASGFIFGQNYWLGSREGCGSIQRPLTLTLSRNYDRVMHYALLNQQAPFEMDYRVVYLRHSSPWQVEIKLMTEQILHIGLCLPSSCDSGEIKNLTADYFSIKDNDVYELQPEVLYMKDLKLSQSFFERRSLKLLLATVLATCGLMLCAQQLKVAKQLPAEQEKATGLAPEETELWRLLHTLLNREPVQKIVNCFDLSNNWRKISAIRENSPSDIPLLNGLRSISAIWLVVFHVMWYMYFTVHNKSVLIAYGEQAFFQYVSSAPLLVDVFFTISGFLQTYNFLRNTQQLEAVRQNGILANVKLYGKLLFHRYLRLGPLYLMILATTDLVFAYVGDTSVYHMPEKLDELCPQYWWRNIFFIQNLFRHEEMCANWTWSLACDMQFFVLANLLLFVYAKHPKLAKSLVVGILLGTISWSFGIGISHKFEFSFDALFATGSEIYMSSFVRILPYIVGGISAWCLLEPKLKYELTEIQDRFLWHFFLMVFFISIHSTVKRDLGSLITTFLFVMGRLIFSVSVCWMIVGSATGRGVWWSRLLESPYFQHPSRVSYGIYLLNPIIIAGIYGLTNSSTHADPFMLGVVCFGFVMFVYLTSIVYTMAFEVPYGNLSSLLSKWESKKPKTS